MKRVQGFFVSILLLMILVGCSEAQEEFSNKTAPNILENPNYLEISYGGYRQNSRDIQPTLDELKDDIKLLEAMGIKILWTYNDHFSQASNLLKAIRKLKKEDPSFEMYVMLGAWIDCKNAFNWENGEPDHNQECERNPKQTAISLAQKYTDIVKIIVVGNETIVKWVNHLQDLKQSGKLFKDLWIANFDNFASWGGGGNEYHVEDLEKLIRAGDYICMHTYPMHNIHYNPQFWVVLESEKELSKIDTAILRSKACAIFQYDRVGSYLESLGIDKPIHIGETGWAIFSNSQYSNKGSRATDEYKQAVYYNYIGEWREELGMSYF